MPGPLLLNTSRPVIFVLHRWYAGDGIDCSCRFFGGIRHPILGLRMMQFTVRLMTLLQVPLTLEYEVVCTSWLLWVDC